MIHLPKTYLEEITNTLILANTPKSLLKGLLKTKAVETLRRDCTAADLSEYYQQITAKGSRSPFVTALAYAVLVTLLTKSPPPDPSPDSSFLSDWSSVVGRCRRCSESRAISRRTATRPSGSCSGRLIAYNDLTTRRKGRVGSDLNSESFRPPRRAG
jgi:hypothetical protein